MIVMFAGLLFAACSKTSNVACTLEAKICPDGSAVGRTGPKCEFAACPTPQPGQKSGIKGTVTLGPTCPVERIPPDPQCAPKPYEAQFVLTTENTNQIVQQFSSDSLGKFTLVVPAGKYVISPAPGAKMLPRCSSQTVTVKQDVYTDVAISCDTGIR